jgi:hypothetical protein
MMGFPSFRESPMIGVIRQFEDTSSNKPPLSMRKRTRSDGWHKAAAVGRIQGERWFAAVDGGFGRSRHAQSGPNVEGEVVVEKLANERGSRSCGSGCPHCSQSSAISFLVRGDW